MSVPFCCCAFLNAPHLNSDSERVTCQQGYQFDNSSRGWNTRCCARWLTRQREHRHSKVSQHSVLPRRSLSWYAIRHLSALYWRVCSLLVTLLERRSVAISRIITVVSWRLWVVWRWVSGLALAPLIRRIGGCSWFYAFALGYSRIKPIVTGCVNGSVQRISTHPGKWVF